MVTLRDNKSLATSHNGSKVKNPLFPVTFKRDTLDSNKYDNGRDKRTIYDFGNSAFLYAGVGNEKSDFNKHARSYNQSPNKFASDTNIIG